MNSSKRKYYLHMTKEEKVFLKRTALEIRNWDMSNHTKQRMEERGFLNNKDIADVITYGDIIEYHLRNGLSRVLIRGNKSYYGYVPCIVFELKSSMIITFYWNSETDDHKTIDMSRYDEKIDIIESFKKSA